MKRMEKKILRGLVNYWDGKKEKWEHGPIPDQGDPVSETILAQSLNFTSPIAPELNLDFSGAVAALKNRGLLRREKNILGVDGELDAHELAPTPEGMRQVDVWASTTKQWTIGIATGVIITVIGGIIAGIILEWVS